MAFRSKQMLLAAALAAAGSLGSPAAQAAEGGPHTLFVQPTGPVEVVFDWSRDACVKSHVPDAPARAFRDADGKVHLIISHNDNRAHVGETLDMIARDCTVIHEAHRSPRLAEFDDLSWISGVHTRDGKTVFALAHTELRGERTQGQCPEGTYSACLLNTVTGLISRDGGRSFQPADNKGRPPVVATLPYPFPTDRKSRVGYANPTNIIEHDGWFYAFMFADSYKAQGRGNCLIRTRTLADPSSWRAWDGKDFSVRFVDPFRDAVADPQAHLCAPVAPQVINRMIGGLVRHRSSGAFIAIFGDKRQQADGRMVEGIFTSTSRDLKAWSEPSLVLEVQLLWDLACGDQDAFFYPSLIDPAANTFSFEDFGDTGFVYMARYQNFRNCKVTWDRDLVRVPVRVRSSW
ncbi:MAG: hypothetical protein M3O00_13325 [Pseudomonadota bacterium]|jgi:hypothetical protein|nr:hypothetical protein [Pseudomonadota bacterium]